MFITSLRVVYGVVSVFVSCQKLLSMVNSVVKKKKEGNV